MKLLEKIKQPKGFDSRDLSRREIAFIVLLVLAMAVGAAFIGRESYAPSWNRSALTTLQEGILPVFGSILIMICSVILVALDVIRAVGKRRQRGLIIIALFGIDAIFYSFVQTDLIYRTFGNRDFFIALEEVSFMLMPVFLTGFYFRGFKIHFPRVCRGLFYTSSAIALLGLFTYTNWGRYHTLFSALHLCWRIAVLIMLIVMLFRWKKRDPETRKIFWDIAALVCLLVSVLAEPAQITGHNVLLLKVIQMTGLAGYFIFMVSMHIQIILAEVQARSRQQLKALKEQNLKMIIANQEADQARLEAIEATKAKSRFLANMSHEIRTPINAVLGMDEMILRESRDPVILDYAADIESAGRTLLSLINDILDFSKIEAGNMEIVPVEYEFAQLAGDLLLMIAPRVSAKGLDFVSQFDENIPCILYGDDVRLRQCVMNLLTNAVKYTHKGTVTLSISAERDGDHAVLRFEVADTGIGIKDEDLPKLFHEYERIEENRNRNIEGTGLGMNITLEMLKLMDSRLDVESEYGKGSVFSFEVRQKIIDPTPVGTISAHAGQAAAASHRGGSFIAPDARILVTDDNTMNRKVFTQLLRRIRCRIDEAESGAEAIEKASENTYDIIFMDHMMPEMDGIEAMEQIRKLPDFSPDRTKVFVLTANAVTGAREMYLTAGFDGFISKPIRSDVLERTIRDNLPSDMLSEAPEDEIPETDTASAPPEDLPIVDGLDWDFAWVHLPGEEMLAETLKQFFFLIPVQADKLDKMAAALYDEGGMDAYRIQVHGMKGLAATVGIIPLAGTAKVLEAAAKNGRADVIGSLHPIFMEEWRSYRKKLIGVMGIEEEASSEKKEEAPYGETVKRLMQLKQVMEEFDIDEGDRLIGECKAFRYPPQTEELIDELAGAVADIDSDLVCELVDRFLQLPPW